MARKPQKSVGADVVCEFLEVAWHQILYLRDLYPASVFGRRRMYGVIVRMCMHPEVASYIARALETVRECMLRREVDAIVFAVTNAPERTVEQYVFEVVLSERQGQGEFEDAFLLELEALLRASLLRLTSYAGQLPSLDGDPSFRILISTRRDGCERLAVHSAAKVNPLNWVEAKRNEKVEPPSHLLPINSFVSERVKLQLFAQCSTAVTASSAPKDAASLDW